MDIKNKTLKEEKKPNSKKNKKMREKKKKKKELEALNETIDCDLKNVREIQTTLINLNSFPSGNIIALFNKNIIIYDIDFKEIQKIENAHEDNIHNADIKDENNFVTCSDDLNIKTWIKKNNKFVLNKTIIKAHSYYYKSLSQLTIYEIILKGLYSDKTTFSIKKNK